MGRQWVLVVSGEAVLVTMACMVAGAAGVAEVAAGEGHRVVAGVALAWVAGLAGPAAATAWCLVALRTLVCSLAAHQLGSHTAGWAVALPPTALLACRRLQPLAVAGRVLAVAPTQGRIGEAAAAAHRAARVLLLLLAQMQQALGQHLAGQSMPMLALWVLGRRQQRLHPHRQVLALSLVAAGAVVAGAAGARDQGSRAGCHGEEQGPLALATRWCMCPRASSSSRQVEIRPGLDSSTCFRSEQRWWF